MGLYRWQREILHPGPQKGTLTFRVILYVIINWYQLLGLFEQIHQLQLTCARLAGSKVLVTAGTDCTISAWTIISSSKAIDLQPKGTLYGHLGPVVILEVSEAFSTLLSASADGAVLLWDLNRLKFVRKLKLQNGSPQVWGFLFLLRFSRSSEVIQRVS